MVKSMRELQAANLPRLHWHDLFNDRTGAVDEAQSLILDNYFGAFVRVEDNKCIACGAELGGMFGCFEWGIQSGEGCCGRCKYPARGHHYHIGSLLQFLAAVLQYHPNSLETTP